ncbi:bifunctional diguanylate cyclase/phosphodiesterase [Lacibacterium aquatile]|uniref:Bifunctional diguanylate cyclase/phosphodiesterase n=1 Tax=Lacibacterium aquatile TaxID=1168082 RepID=A0ABW5DPQ0_9PROT
MLAALDATPRRMAPTPAGLTNLDYAFQPIVAMRTGRTLGFEALLRGLDSSQYPTPAALFEEAFADGRLVDLETTLRATALSKFGRRAEALDEAMLFLNVDVRLFSSAGYDARLTIDLLDRARLSPTGICLELAERHEFTMAGQAADIFEHYRRSGFCVAIDDFGVGFAGLKLLYDAKPDFIKIDRFFISGIDQDVLKRGLVEQVVRYAHIRGTQVIAEGIERDAEFYVCRDLGCDFAQGYLIARPTMALEEMEARYDVVSDLNARDRRRRQSTPAAMPAEAMEMVEPLPLNLKRGELLDFFRNDDAPSIVPVLDERKRPLGVVRERELKPFAYSRYGGELLRNKGIGDSIREFIRPCPVCDVETRVDRIVEAFSGDAAADGIILTEEGRYVGFLSPRALLKLVNEYNLAAASDQNPLSRLPGNHRIERHLEQVVDDTSRPACLVYFDFDNFKPFNDTYGFRQGDRAILMFAELLRNAATSHGGFAGHVGGDDFFFGLSGLPEEEALTIVADIVAKFRTDAESLYDAEARAAGFITAKDRFGETREFPLLRVSGVVVCMNPESLRPTVDAFGILAAERKPRAKEIFNHLYIERLP